MDFNRGAVFIGVIGPTYQVYIRDPGSCANGGANSDRRRNAAVGVLYYPAQSPQLWAECASPLV